MSQYQTMLGSLHHLQNITSNTGIFSTCAGLFLEQRVTLHVRTQHMYLLWTVEGLLLTFGLLQCMV